MTKLKPPYEGMAPFYQGQSAYSVHEDVFTDEIAADIKTKTGLEKSAWLGDWWIFQDSNPIFSWPTLIRLALNILNCEATRLYVENLYLQTPPKGYQINTDAPLPTGYVSGAKRVNAYSGKIMVYNQITRKEDEVDAGRGFRLSGKDETCCVEGSWLHWVCFACNVLASENTKMICPDLYEPELANNNY